MTDEEKANVYHLNNVTSEEVYYHAGMSEKVRRAYLDGLAEGRKERTLSMEQWKQEWQDAQIKANEEGFARTTLQIKYAELSNSVTELTNSKTELENKVTELEKQIEKMKCCGNCKHCEFKIVSDGSTRAICSRLKGDVCLSNNYEDWELAE